MKKIIVLCISLFLVVGLGLYFYINSRPTETPVIKYKEKVVPIEEPSQDLFEERVEEIVSTMTLEEKIGQMMIVSYRNPYMTYELRNILETVKPGGFILFAENFTDYNTTINLINDINSTAKINMFMSVDQEGGRVQRLQSMSGLDINYIPTMQEIGATNDENVAYNTGVTIANDLKKLGINLDFAPVLDVFQSDSHTFIEDRCFSSDPKIVSKMGIALAKGLSDNNIIATYKHFPGHGNTSTDSHYNLPIVTRSKEELLNNDLVPFIDAIENDAQMIMIGHLAIPTITNDNVPASLSKVLITDLLKNELGYKNLVITDALNMQALTNNYSDKQIYEMAINAGVDILLMPNNPIEAVNLIKQSINEGTLSEERIEESVKKIITLKINKSIITEY